jgi:hypothetical protein
MMGDSKGSMSDGKKLTEMYPQHTKSAGKCIKGRSWIACPYYKETNCSLNNARTHDICQQLQELYKDWQRRRSLIKEVKLGLWKKQKMF